MKLILHFVVSALAIAVAAYLLPSVTISGWQTLAMVTIGISLVNVLIKPVLHLIALPVTIITLGLFSLVINALLVLLVAKFVPGFQVGGFWAALFFGILLSLISAAFHKIAA
ncbi:MAG: phage holin family protein, partial [bacterium]